MKLKHFSGYGSVNAFKVDKKINGTTCALTIKVVGDHERGLYLWDIYDLKRWLIDRFDKQAKGLNPYRMRFDYHYDFSAETETIYYLFMYDYNDNYVD